jgi:hypothetical protein
VDYNYKIKKELKVKPCNFYEPEESRAHMNSIWYSNTYCVDTYYEYFQGGWDSDSEHSNRIMIDIIRKMTYSKR